IFFCHFDKFAGCNAVLLLAFQHSISHCSSVDLDSTDGVVVTRDNVVDTVRVGVGIHDTNNRNTQLVGFLNGNALVINVDYEQHVRQAAHVFDTTDRTLQLLHFTGTHQSFFFVQLLKSTVGALAVQIPETFDGLSDGFVVGQHTAEPAVRYESHASTLGLLFHDFTSGAFGTNKQNFVVTGSHGFNQFQRIIHGRNSVLQVDDVN